MPHMEKSKTFEFLVGGALLGGAFYYLFYTERGEQFRERMAELALDKLDEWLAIMEQELTEAEYRAKSETGEAAADEPDA